MTLDLNKIPNDPLPAVAERLRRALAKIRGGRPLGARERLEICTLLEPFVLYFEQQARRRTWATIVAEHADELQRRRHLTTKAAVTLAIGKGSAKDFQRVTRALARLRARRAR